MRVPAAILTACLAVVLLFGFSRPAAAQRALPDIPSPDIWGSKLETGVFWGQLFGGLAAQNDKTTFMKLRAEIFRNVRILTVANPQNSWQRPTGNTANAPQRGSGVLQLGGGIGISRYGFPDEAEDFFGESGYSVTTIMGGARYVLPPRPQFLLFVQAQAGLERSFGESAFAISPEGGVIVPVGNDWLLTTTAGIRKAFADGAGTAFELGVGLTFPFGGR